mmetsp:Transcript_21166/g.42206  ORF Transcript_21166/g.42206 Transcript_21166/m.42206 type:complete len:637 (-) Transcript_21166:13-1923(-)
MSSVGLFRSALSLKDDAMATRFCNLAEHHGLNVSSMSDEWEAFQMANNDAQADDTTFQAFRSFLSKAMSKSSKNKSSLINDTKDLKRKALDTKQLMSPPAANKAMKQEAGSSNAPASRVSTSPAPAYEDRKNVGQVMAHFNSHLPDREKVDTSLVGVAGPNAPKVSTDAFDTNVEQKYRYMFTPLPERAAALDKRLEDMGKQMEDAFDMKDLCAVGVPRTDTIKVVGRICNEAHTGKLNKTTVQLEGSRSSAGGRRVELDVSELKTFSVFPGQVVGVEGRNPGGRKMVAGKVCEGVMKPLEKTSAGEMLELQHGSGAQDGKPLSVIAAAGPFTTNQNFDFEPMSDLLHVVSRLRPDVVILAGPFVPSEHPQAREGVVHLTDEEGQNLTVTFENIFSEKFSKLLEDTYLDHPDLHTQFVLVPSLDDAFHDNVFPQPPFSDRKAGGDEGGTMDIPGAEGIQVGSLGLNYVESAGRESTPSSTWPKRVHCVSNPATFKINEVVFGVTSVDPIFSLTTQDCSAGINRMQRMAQHLVQQQSYYPVFPAPNKANLDLRHLSKTTMPVTPDVLLVPSKLAPFVKDVLGSVVINPQQLSRGSTGGTFATIDVQPVKREELENAGEGVMMEHKVTERAKVAVMKI